MWRIHDCSSSLLAYVSNMAATSALEAALVAESVLTVRSMPFKFSCRRQGLCTFL